MKHSHVPIPEVTLQRWEKQYEADGETVLSATCSLPHCASLPSAAAKRFDRFYRHMERCFRQRSAALAKRAAEAQSAARASSRWFTPWACTLQATVERTEDVLSVCWTLEEQPGVSFSGTERWESATGFPLP